MTDQEKIQDITERLTGFTPINVVRDEVLGWMRDNMDLACMHPRNREVSVTFESAKRAEYFRISAADWRTLLRVAELPR